MAAVAAAASVWEEAEAEFYQEAFLRDRQSLSSTLESSTHPNSASVDTVIHRPLLHGGSSSSSRPMVKKSSRSRSERMRAAIHGLVTEESDEGTDVADYEASNPPWGGNNGGGEFFLNENVVTPIESWRNMLRLRESNLSLKNKKKIRRQCQKQPVLKQDAVDTLSWKMEKALWTIRQALKRIGSAVCTSLLPSKRIEARRGRPHFLFVFMQKKILFIAIALYVVSVLPFLFFCCDTNGCEINYWDDTTNAASKNNLTFEETLLSRGGGESFHVFLPLKAMDSFLQANKYFVPRPNILIYVVCFIVVYLFWWQQCISALKLRHFQLDSSSVFRDVMWMTTARTALRSKESKKVLHMTYRSIKTKISLGWRRWSTSGITIALVINLLLICSIVFAGYFLLYDTLADKLDEGDSGLRLGASTYFIVWSIAFVCCKYGIPSLMFLLSNLGYQCPEANVNFFTARCFFALLSFYVMLILSVTMRYPHAWKDILVNHLYLHILIDVAAMPSHLLFVCLPASVQQTAVAAFPGLHPCHDFMGHKAIVHFAMDLFVTTVALPLSVSLFYLQTFKFLLAYAFATLSACITWSHPMVQSNCSNIRFLETCFTVTVLTLSVPLQIVICLPLASECHSLKALLDLAKVSVPTDRQHATAQLMDSMTTANAIIACLVIILIAIIFRSRISEFCLDRQSHFLRRHLEEINQDKNYQVMKQKQWYPSCKCHEARTNRKNVRKESKNQKKPEQVSSNKIC